MNNKSKSKTYEVEFKELLAKYFMESRETPPESLLLQKRESDLAINSNNAAETRSAEQIIMSKLISLSHLNPIEKELQINKEAIDELKLKGSKSEYKKVSKKEPSKYLNLKNRSDCIRKRIKTYFNNYVYDRIHEVAKEYEDLFLFKLPTVLITNITKSYNESILKMTVKELYSKEIKNEESRIQHNVSMLNKLTSTEAHGILSRKCYSLFYEYLSYSTEYMRDLRILYAKEGEKYVRLFHEHMLSFMSYYNVDLDIAKKEELKDEVKPPEGESRIGISVESLMGIIKIEAENHMYYQTVEEKIEKENKLKSLFVVRPSASKYGVNEESNNSMKIEDEI